MKKLSFIIFSFLSTLSYGMEKDENLLVFKFPNDISRSLDLGIESGNVLIFLRVDSVSDILLDKKDLSFFSVEKEDYIWIVKKDVIYRGEVVINGAILFISIFYEKSGLYSYLGDISGTLNFDKGVYYFNKKNKQQ